MRLAVLGLLREHTRAEQNSQIVTNNKAHGPEQVKNEVVGQTDQPRKPCVPGCVTSDHVSVPEPGGQHRQQQHGSSDRPCMHDHDMHNVVACTQSF